MLRFNPIDIIKRRLARFGKLIFSEIKDFYSDFARYVRERNFEDAFLGTFGVQDSNFCFLVVPSEDFVDHLRVRRFLVDCGYSVIFVLYASESLIRFAVDNSDRVCLFVYSLRKCFGCDGKFGSFVFDSIKKRLPDVTLSSDVVESGLALRYFEQYCVLEYLFGDVWRKYIALGFRSSVAFLCKFWRYLKWLLGSSKSEIDINNALISFLKYLGFRVFDFSNTPGNADIVVGYPVPLIVEVKREKAVEKDLDQVVRYLDLYRYAHEKTRYLKLDWYALLVAKNFSSGLKIKAEKEGVSLLTFRGFFRFIVLLSTLGVTWGMIKRLLVGGAVGGRVTKLYRSRLREILGVDLSNWGDVLLLRDGDKFNELFLLYGSRLLNLLSRVIRNEEVPRCLKIRF